MISRNISQAKGEESKGNYPGLHRGPSDFSSPFERLPSLYRMPSALQEMPCYSAKAPSIRLSNETPSQREAVRGLKQIVSKLLKDNEDLQKYEKVVLRPEQVVDKEYLGHICTAMMLNELEIITWCYGIYLLLDYELIDELNGNESILKFSTPDELVLSCSIFAKFAANDINEKYANSIIRKLQLNKEHLLAMYQQIEPILEDPIQMDAFYLEMRLSNDPDMSKHAEDYNLMVLDMVKQTNIRSGLLNANLIASQQVGQVSQQQNGNHQNNGYQQQTEGVFPGVTSTQQLPPQLQRAAPQTMNPPANIQTPQMSYNPSFNQWANSAQDYSGIDQMNIDDEVEKLMPKGQRRQESNYSFGDPRNMDPGLISRGTSVLPTLEYGSFSGSLNGTLQKLREQRKERKLNASPYNIFTSAGKNSNSKLSQNTSSIATLNKLESTSKEISIDVKANLQQKFGEGNISRDRNDTKTMQKSISNNQLLGLSKSTSKKSRNLQNQNIFNSQRNSVQEECSFNIVKNGNQFVSKVQANQAPINNKVSTLTKQSTNYLSELANNNLTSRQEGNFSTRTVEIDIQSLIDNAASSRAKTRNVSNNQGRSKSRDTSANRSIIGPSYVKRKDHFNDDLSNLVDQNIEQVARLVAIKQKIQNDIFDQSRVHQNLMADINYENQKNSQLISQVQFGQQNQRHLNFQVMQLENSIRILEDKQSQTFQNLREELKSINYIRTELKQKVNNDTAQTSYHIKEMERQRVLSSDRVSKTELYEDQISRDLTSLKNLMSRGHLNYYGGYHSWQNNKEI
eukprot:403365476